MEDYSAFSMEAIQTSLAETRQKMIDLGLSKGFNQELAEGMVDFAFIHAGRAVMEVNGFVEPNRPPSCPKCGNPGEDGIRSYGEERHGMYCPRCGHTK
jgi:hypothetical protein